MKKNLNKSKVSENMQQKNKLNRQKKKTIKTTTAKKHREGKTMDIIWSTIVAVNLILPNCIVYEK